MAKHSPFGASGAHRWLACPASVPRSVGIEDRKSDAAAEGTLLHETAELVLRGRHKAVADRLRTLTDEQRNVVSTYVNAVRDVENQEGFRGKAYELRCSATHLHPQFYGTADAVIEGRGWVTILDLKCGAGLVSTDYNHKLNPQLGYYLICALAAMGVLIFPDRIEGKHPPARLEIVIVQPRNGGVKRRPVLLLELMDLAGELVEAARLAETHSPPAQAGSHCKFCPARGKCPTLRAKVLEDAKMEFGAFPDPLDMTAEELSEALRNAALMEVWIDGVRAHAKDVLARGKPVPGFRLVERWGNRVWRDEQQVAKGLRVLAEAANIPSSNFYHPEELKSPAQVEATLKRYGLKSDIANVLTERKPASAALVADSDRRNAKTDFEEE